MSVITIKCKEIKNCLRHSAQPYPNEMSHVAFLYLQTENILTQNVHVDVNRYYNETRKRNRNEILFFLVHKLYL